MKLKCVKNTQTKGLINKREEEIEGLTRGKTYMGAIVAVSEGIDMVSSTTVAVIFDDDGNWSEHDLRLFEPLE